VIALSVKDLPRQTFQTIQSISRDEVESDLNFLGLLVMENKMKD
jgi:magnesium-transporting ATPase (P-type)